MLHCTGATFNLSMDRQITVRRKANEVEDILSPQYAPPMVISLPDDADPASARLVLTSHHGFSQIQVSQTGIALAVNFSEDFQTNSELRYKYIKERIPSLYRVVNEVFGIYPAFCGYIRGYQFRTQGSHVELMDILHKVARITEDEPDTIDLIIRRTRVVGDQFFSNTTYENYREWDRNSPEFYPSPLAYKDAKSHGISITNDLNDRYSFNEKPGYHTDLSAAEEILHLAINEEENISDLLRTQK